MAETTRTLWLNELSGSVNQATAPHLLNDNQFKNLENCTQMELGTVAHRLGTSLVGDVIEGETEVKGLHSLELGDGTRYFHMAEGGNLRVYNETTSLWDMQESGVWLEDSTVDMVNYIDRHYMVGSSTSEYLRYTTDNSAATTLVSGDVTGKYLSSNDTYLVIVDPDNKRFKWSDVISDVFDAANYYVLNGVGTGVGSFGIGRPFVVFTDRNYVIADPANEYFAQVHGYGCTSHRSIQTVRGNIIFMGRDGLYTLGVNDAYPLEISRLIRNEYSKDAIFNQIDGANWAVLASGVIDSRYFCALRNLSGKVKGLTFNDCVIEYDTAMQTIKCHTFTDGGIGSVMSQFINTNGDMDLYAGSVDNKAVYKMLVTGTYTDDDEEDEANNVTCRVVTKDHEFLSTSKQVGIELNIESLFFRYLATDLVDIKRSLDGGAYESIPTRLPITSTAHDWEIVEVPLGEHCKTISLEMYTTGQFELYGLGYKVQTQGDSGIKLT